MQLARFLGDVYPSWSSDRYYDLLGRLGVPSRPAIDALYPAVRARLALGAALAIDPKLLLVDVPELDARGRADLLLGLREERGDRSVLVASAHPAELDGLADQLERQARCSTPPVPAGGAGRVGAATPNPTTGSPTRKFFRMDGHPE